MVDESTAFDPDIEQTIESVIRSIYRQSDLSLDLDRNLEDSQFLRHHKGFGDDIVNGRMTFVFDPNIFEVFIDPTIRRARTASFHNDDWYSDDGSDVVPPSRRQAIAAQTAALTAEYLFSNAFRHRGDGFIYLTEWHYKELSIRLIDFARDAAQITPNLERERNRFDRILEARQVLERAKSKSDIDARVLKSPLAEDVQDILSRKKLQPRRLSSFVANRLVLDVLCEENEVEKLDQIERLVSSETADNLRLLNQKFKPSPAQRIDIERDAYIWIDLFEKERLRSPGSEGRSRTPGALLADARSLAYVVWVARQLATRSNERLAQAYQDFDDNQQPEEERIVFITADDIVFDSYRRWYAERPIRDPDFRLPFLLRRLIQFAPVFNLSDADSNFTDNAREFFRRLKVAVEVASLPVNLSQSDRPIRYHMRELDALKLKERESISTQSGYLPLAEAIRVNEPRQRKKELDELLRYWRLVERFTLGLFDDFVQSRLTDIERNLPALRQDDPEVYEKAFNEYFTARITSIIDNSLAIALPLAKETIQHWTPMMERPRVPVAFFLPLAEFESIDLGVRLRQALQTRQPKPFQLTDEIWAALERQPEAVFGVAAWLSLISEQWREAERYTEQALLATKLGLSDGDAVMTEPQAEMGYIFALTKRYQIAVIGRPSNVEDRRRLHSLHHQGLEMIDRCIRAHEIEAQGMRMQRAKSERAACNLFYAATFTLANATDEANPERETKGTTSPLNRASFFLMQTFNDLAECFQNDQKTANEPQRDPERASVDQRIREQFSINFCSAYVLNNIWNASMEPNRLREHFDVDAYILKLIPDYIKPENDAPPLLKLSLLTYLKITNNYHHVKDYIEQLQAMNDLYEASSKSDRPISHPLGQLEHLPGTRLRLDVQMFEVFLRHLNRIWWTE